MEQVVVNRKVDRRRVHTHGRELVAVSVRVDALARSRTDFIQSIDEFFRIGPIGRRGMPAEHKAVPTVRGGVDLVAVMPGFLEVRSFMVASIILDGENIFQLHKITTYYQI